MSDKLSKDDFSIQDAYEESFDIHLEGEELNSLGSSIDSLDVEDTKPTNIMEDKKKLLTIVGAVIILVVIVLIIIIAGGKGGKKRVPELGLEPMPFVDNTVTESTARFSSDEVYKLREIGYTGREIQQYEANGYDANQLYNDAVKTRDKYLRDRYIQLSENIQNVDIRKLMDTTWYGLPQQTVEAAVYDPATGDESFEKSTDTARRDNVDYEKVPFYGYQTLIKLYLPGGYTTYYSINPYRYLDMPDKGNIVVNYIIRQHRGATFIIDIREEGY